MIPRAADSAGEVAAIFLHARTTAMGALVPVVAVATGRTYLFLHPSTSSLEGGIGAKTAPAPRARQHDDSPPRFSFDTGVTANNGNALCKMQ